MADPAGADLGRRHPADGSALYLVDDADSVGAHSVSAVDHADEPHQCWTLDAQARFAADARGDQYSNRAGHTGGADGGRGRVGNETYRGEVTRSDDGGTDTCY